MYWLCVWIAAHHFEILGFVGLNKVALEVLGWLCAIVSLGGDVALFGAIAKAESVHLDFFLQKYFIDI